MRGFLKNIGCLFAFLFMLQGSLFAQSGKGSPVIQNYLPKQYKEVSNGSQNWSFVQDKRGLIYIGNTEGLMEYDGCRWHIVHTSNNSVVRSLDIDKSGRIYLGAAGDFGYLSYNASGEAYFVSLSMLLKPRDRDFSDVWATYATKSGVYFVTNNKIFKYKDRKIKLIYSTSRISAFKAFDRIFIVNKSGSGIYRIDKDRFELMPNTQGLRAIALSEFMGNKLIGVTADNSFFTYDLKILNTVQKQEAVRPFQTELNRLHGSEQTVYFQIKKTNNNQFVVNTIYNGLYVIDNLGRIVTAVNKQTGLTSNNIYNFYIDTDNRLWMALDKGFANLDLNSPTSMFTERNGLDGSPMTLYNYNNQIYIGTEKSVFRVEPSRTSGGQLSRVQNYPPGAVWDFTSFMGKLLLGSNNGLYQIDGLTAKQLNPIPNIYTLSAHPKQKDLLFAGTENSLLAFKASSTASSNDLLLEGPLPIVKNASPVRSMAVDQKGNLWASCSFRGIYFVPFPIDFNNSAPYVLADTANGLGSLNGNYVSCINNDITVSSNSGVYSAHRSGADNSIRFSKDVGFAAQVNKIKVTVDQLFCDPKGKLWLFSEKMGFGELSNTAKGLIWDYSQFSSIPSYEINKFVVDNNDIVWGLSNSCIYRIDLASIRRNHSQFNALVRGVRLAKDSVLFGGNYSAVVKTEDGNELVSSLKQARYTYKEIEYAHNSVFFDFSSTCYTDENQVQYSYKLEGLDNNWSDWSTVSSKEFSHLFEGKYTLHVKARNTFGQISSEAVYSFRILAPWYRSVWAGLVYLVALFFIFRRMYSYITEKFRLDKARLELLIQERTSMLSQKNVELINNRAEVIAQKEQLELQNKKFEEISREHEKLSIVASKTENAVLIMDASGNFEWVNESYERMFGYTLQELIALISPNIIGKNTPEYVREAVGKCLSQKVSVGYEFSTLSRNGEKLWVQVTLTPILDENGQIYKIIAVDTDITRTKNTEFELIKRSEEIRSQISLYDSQKRFIDNLQRRISLLKEFSLNIHQHDTFLVISTEARTFLSKVIDVSFFGIGLLNRQRAILEFNNFVENGLNLPYFHNSIYQTDSFCAWVYNNKSSLLVKDIDKEYRNYLDDEPDFETITKPRSLIYSPLIVNSEVYGVITVHSAQVDAYQQDDLDLLDIVASEISSLLTNVANVKQIRNHESLINDSIKHGKGAFSLMLPEKGTLDRFYKCFITFKPKDQISGDFYWFSRVQSDEMLLKTIVVVGDCTGHDCSGAFISMVSMYMLREIVEKRKILQPSRVLELIDEKLIDFLSVQGDCVEVAVCLLEQKAEGGVQLTFSGARRPVHIFKSSENEIRTIKGTRRPLGDKKSRSLNAFKAETIMLNSGDLLYLATDGISSQMNITGQKFGLDAFCKVLKDNAYRPLHEQKERLDYSFDFFRGLEKQRDDIVVVGIKV